ncbi:hypothetical protein CHARACLAT_020115 [Characodon lateralis]|uniref:Uncharacterized protein n=1 Tax=Characodon lateralis TaxID=208331 RepID=A0ABU7EB88_9TELE|nr:hypothetical protein [Characodon lateralis]
MVASFVSGGLQEGAPKHNNRIRVTHRRVIEEVRVKLHTGMESNSSLSPDFKFLLLLLLQYNSQRNLKGLQKVWKTNDQEHFKRSEESIKIRNDSRILYSMITKYINVYF